MDTNHTESVTAETEAPTQTRYTELTKLVASMEQDFHKFFVQGNKAAGTRVRQSMQELKNFAQTVRAEVLSRKAEGKSQPQ
jgi:Na+/phosphate symporter